MSVGQELLDVPLPEMVKNLGLGIARAQDALDDNSIETAKALSSTNICDEKEEGYLLKYVATIDEEKGEAVGEVPVRVKNLPLIAFLHPTFYQFSEASIEVEMDIKTKLTRSTSAKVKAEASVGYGPFSASISAEAKHSRKFGKEVHGSSRLFVKMVPVPAPESLMPDIDIRWKGSDEGSGSGGNG